MVRIKETYVKKDHVERMWNPFVIRSLVVLVGKLSYFTLFNHFYPSYRYSVKKGGLYIQDWGSEKREVEVEVVITIYGSPYVFDHKMKSNSS